ncbi:MAG: fibrobacter succinogenes major paralogous domain-containing protein [Bacteroidia bacterium]|nr:fibrobacter succinogenes major paralogous domain-containing protein [Bacteroidia bacterium]
MKKILFFLFFALTFIVSFSQSTNQVINLPQGWSIFSTYIQPAQPAISSVMLPVASEISIVKDGGGHVYWPQYGLNTIGIIETGRGYKTKMVSTQNLTISGTQVNPENFPIIVPIGWSMIGYLRSIPTKIDSAFSSIIDNLIMVKDDLGNVYWPIQGLNQIGFLVSSKGYDIKLLNTDTLLYNANSFNCGTDALSDYDGNLYNTVQIGNQCWMKENLATIHYADGTTLVDGTNVGDITSDYSNKYWFVYNNIMSYKVTYGLLYTWASIMNGATSSNTTPSGVQGICPTGWHVPSQTEWINLINYYGGGYAGGGKLKETGISHWNNPNEGATNESNFTALPGGYRANDGTFNDIGMVGAWFTAKEYSETNAWFFYLSYASEGISDASIDYKSIGYSIRCLMDYTSQVTLPTVTTSSIINITQTTAIGGGWTNSDGGATIIARGVCWNISGNPTLVDSHTTDGSDIGFFTSSLIGLSAYTSYFVRAYTTNSVGTFYGNEITFTTSAWAIPCPDGSTIIDYDGNTYNTVQIGTQCWMKENLKTKHYADGTSLVDGTNVGNISNDYSTKYWFVYNYPSSNFEVYGLLYTWAAVMNGVTSSNGNPSGVQGICPSGWHVPGDDEWKQLEIFIGMSEVQANSLGWRGSNQGEILKETGDSHWQHSSNNEATNISGFTALPGGGRNSSGNNFVTLEQYGYWWSTTDQNEANANARILYFDSGQVYRDNYLKSTGYSVRCLKNN